MMQLKEDGQVTILEAIACARYRMTSDNNDLVSTSLVNRWLDYIESIARQEDGHAGDGE